MKINAKLVEHYLIAFGVSAVSIWQTGNHHFKAVAWAAAIGVFGPVLSAAYSHLKSTQTK
jgi:energy-converting hydrogenase Eha subunit A